MVSGGLLESLLVALSPIATGIARYQLHPCQSAVGMAAKLIDLTICCTERVEYCVDHLYRMIQLTCT